MNVCIVCIDCKTDVVWCRDGTAQPCMRQKSAYVGFWWAREWGSVVAKQKLKFKSCLSVERGSGLSIV